MSKFSKKVLFLYLATLVLAYIISNLLYWCIIMTVLFLQLSNMMLRKWVDNKTKYKESMAYEDEKLRYFYMYFGFPITIFFPKPFRQIRKDAYYERRVKELVDLKEFYESHGKDMTEQLKDELVDCNRYLKLKKIKHKQEEA